MNKKAFLEGRSPLEAFIASTLAGGGSFAALRLLKEMSNQTQPKNQPGENENSLSIDIPRPKIANADYAAMNEGMNIPKLLALVAGLPVGFMGTKAIYDNVKQKQMQSEIDRANDKYVQTLGSFKQAGSSETPAVDAFCAGLADVLEKSGFAEGFGFDPSEPEFFTNNAKDSLPIPHGDRKAITEAMLQNDLVSQGINGATFGLADKAIIPVAGIGALLTALGVGTSMATADNKRKNTEKSMQFPSTVKINEV